MFSLPGIPYWLTAAPKRAGTAFPAFIRFLENYIRCIFHLAANSPAELYDELGNNVQGASGMMSLLLAETCSWFLLAMPTFLLETKNLLLRQHRLSLLIYRLCQSTYILPAYITPHPPPVG